jgi:DNA-binding transcriptional MerR regulator
MNAARTLPSKLFYSIGDVARHTGVRPHVLRYWESEFREIAPKKAPNGKRLYRSRDIEAIQAVKALLYGRKFTVEGARRALRSGPGLDSSLGEVLKSVIRDLRRARDIMKVDGRDH